MINVQKYYMHDPGPGGKNDNGDLTPGKDENDSTEPVSDEEQEHKPLGEKIKEALQDWSNKDQADQDFDDTRV
ncbi:MAG: hypothetical protein ABIN67_23485 [Ferruginibacter sp.]